MLLGEYRHNLDTKGRLAIPAKFRESISSGAIITRGLDSCLFVYPAPSWQTLVDRLMALPVTQANPRAFVRLMLSGAADADLDSQGRILVPEYLRTYAGLKKKIVVTGLFSRIEVWDEERWIAYKEKTESASDEIAEKLGQLGI